MKEVKRDEILAALSGKELASDAEHIADILCRKSTPDIRVVYDEAGDARRRWTLKEIVADSFNEHKTMVELPAYLFSSPWVRQRIKDSLGLFLANAFIADAGDNPAVQEILVLAEALRLTYGPVGLPELMDAAVFWQPAYAQFKNKAMPLLEKYVYGDVKGTIYGIARSGWLAEEDVNVVLNIVWSVWPEYRDSKVKLTTGGLPLLDPCKLANMLESGSDNNIVVLKLPERFVPCKNGSGPDGMAVIVSVLREGVKRNPDATSWEILCDAVRQCEKNTEG